MKQFIKNQKVTYNLMSFTGFKALLIFNLLTEGPKSYDEVCDYIFNHPYLREKISVDTFRVYMNTLKRLGCDIKRIKGDDKISRYHITEHPFELRLTEEEQQSIIKVYKNIYKDLGISALLAMDNFFIKLAKYINDSEFLANLRKYSPLRDIDKEVLKNLIECCARKDQIVITYNSPNSGKKHIEIIADSITISNNKVYLCSTGFEYMQYGSFLVNRILRIDEIKLNPTIPNNLKELKIKYRLVCENQEKFEPDKNEKILEHNSGKYLVELTTSNEFLARQKFLAYGPKCTILEPEEFKNNFINMLKDMKAGYYCG